MNTSGMARGSAGAGDVAGRKGATRLLGCKRGPAGQQLTLPLARDGTRRGGKRRGCGRKLATGRRSTPHRSRPRHLASQPVHVTLRACLGPLRSQFLFPTVRLAIAGATRRNPSHFRVVHFSVQSNHLHLIVEAADARSLSAGVRSISVRVARLVNRLLFRTGRFWADRWHGRALTSPREVRCALLYVLANFRKHTRVQPRIGIDPYSSGLTFMGGANGVRAPPRLRRSLNGRRRSWMLRLRPSRLLAAGSLPSAIGALGCWVCESVQRVELWLGKAA
jgi:REP element-mobilizing transposase RayT